LKIFFEFFSFSCVISSSDELRDPSLDIDSSSDKSNNDKHAFGLSAKDGVEA